MAFPRATGASLSPRRSPRHNSLSFVLGNRFPQYGPQPNPHLAEIVDTRCPPKSVPTAYDLDVVAGKNSYVYDAHTYHTKVPPEGIEKLIEHYTRPGDVVFDPFCGSGMTGVAAANLERKSILVDLSPAATFIAYNLLTPVDHRAYMDAVYAVLDMGSDLEKELYATACRECGTRVPMLYTVWSFAVVCSTCRGEFILWDVARDERASVRESKILRQFDCPHCGRHLRKRGLQRKHREPVLVGYQCCGSRQKEATAPPDSADMARLELIEQQGVPKALWYPTTSFPEGVNTNQAIRAGITSVDRAYTTRALWAMAYLWDKACRWKDPAIRSKLLFTLTSLYQRVTLFSEFRFWGGSGNTANYNVPAIANEQNVFRAFERKARTISWYLASCSQASSGFRISTQSACNVPQLPDESVDFVFTDPPFGGNINYSEMNLLWESWLQSFTDDSEEIIVNRYQRKGIDDYRGLLERAFFEMRRVLKANGWMCVVFHNSSAKVWHALRTALHDAGLAIEGTQTFDKKHGTFKQFVSDNAVGYDLVLHCRKAEVGSRRTAEPEVLLSRKSALRFVTAALCRRPENYRVHYQHVNRQDEVDYRRLYSEWLAASVKSSQALLGFEEFREIVSQAGVERVLDCEPHNDSIVPDEPTLL